MTDALATVGHWCRFDKHLKLHFEYDPTRAELDAEIFFLSRVYNACRMSIAKLYLYGVQEFSDQEHGEYVPAKLAPGVTYDTLMGWVRVYRAVPEEIWRDELDYSYHKAVAYQELPTEVKDEYLGRAMVGEFETASELNETVRLEQGLMEKPILLETCCPVCEAPLDERNCNRRCTVCGARPIEWAKAYWHLKNNGDAGQPKTDIEQEAQ